MDDLSHPNDPLVKLCRRVVRVMVRILALMMTGVIILAVVDVAWTLHKLAMAPPAYILTVADVLAAFGAFMVVMIAIEILVNIVLYLRDDVIHVKIVVATALMAIARKVIILDFETAEPAKAYAIGAVVLATGIAYWLVHRHEGSRDASRGHPAAHAVRVTEPHGGAPVPSVTQSVPS